MIDGESRYFTLSLESLRAIGSWTADCAERALPIFETRAGSDPRPREAIEGIREFAGGGKRAARLRSLAMQAIAAAREVDDPAAAAAARAAGRRGRRGPAGASGPRSQEARAQPARHRRSSATGWNRIDRAKQGPAPRPPPGRRCGSHRLKWGTPSPTALTSEPALQRQVLRVQA